MTLSSLLVFIAGVMFMLAWVFSLWEPQTATALSPAYLFLALANFCFSQL
jgi:hypothetical protein